MVARGTAAGEGLGLGLHGLAAGEGLGWHSSWHRSWSCTSQQLAMVLIGTAAGVDLGIVGGESRGLPFVVGRLWLIPGVAGGRAESGNVEDWSKGGGDVHKPTLHHYQEVSSLHLSGPRLRD